MLHAPTSENKTGTESSRTQQAKPEREREQQVHPFGLGWRPARQGVMGGGEAVETSFDWHRGQLAKMQQTLGNQAVLRMMGRSQPAALPIQTKLTISQPGDKYEQEADRIADQVMRMPEPKVQRVCAECEEKLQRQPMEEEEEEEETLQTKPLAAQITPLVQRQTEPMEEEEEELLQPKIISGKSPTVSSSLRNRITALQGGGQPLPQTERAFFEPRFGTNFSQVRIHADSQATETARVVKARAFTVGQNIVFGAGQYQPSASEGRHLLAHELTHVIQQKGNEYQRVTEGNELFILENSGSPSLIQRRILIGNPAPLHEIAPDERRRLLAPGSSHRDVQIIRRHRFGLARRIIDDMVQTSNDLRFWDLYQLQSELIKRLTTSVVMRATQQHGAEWPAFGYPHRGACENYGPRVNFAAKDYWDPEVPDCCETVRAIEGYNRRTPHTASHPSDPSGNYVFRLKPTHRNQGYQALMALFVRQPGVLRRRNRTLIHCDYLASLIQYRSFAAALGEREFNRRVSTLRDPSDPSRGYIIPLELRWNGYMDLGEGEGRPSPGHLQSRHLQRITPPTRDDLVIGDHVIFYNHILYDLLRRIAGGPGVWRLENAILVDRQEGEDFFQGHGSGRHSERGMNLEMRRYFNSIVSRALTELRRTHPPSIVGRLTTLGVLRRDTTTGDYYIVSATERHICPYPPCDPWQRYWLPRGLNWHIHILTSSELNEVPGLYRPGSLSIVGGRPVYDDATRQLNSVWRPVEST